jgi:hypothetical protein
MTSEEMHIATQQGLQRMGSYAFGDVLGEEIDLQLVRMQERFVKQRFDKSLSDPLEFQQTQKRLDDLRTLIVPTVRGTSVAEADIDTNTNFYDVYVTSTVGDSWYIVLPPAIQPWTLPIPTELDPQEDQDAYAAWVASDPEYMFLIDAWVMVKVNSDCDDNTAVMAPVRIVKREFLPRTLKHAFAKSTIESMVGTMVDDKIYIYGDGTLDITEVNINYIKVPRAIVYGPGYIEPSTERVDSELPVHTHNEIVDMTVQHMSALIQAPNYQQQVLETRQNE